MANKVKAGAAPPTVSLARQPIFDDKRRLWGYFLCCVGGHTECSVEDCGGAQVASTLAGSAHLEFQQIIERDKRVLIPFSEHNILDQLHHAMPPSSTVVQVSEETFLRPSVPPILTQLKADGYLLATSDFTASPACASFYSLADLIGMDVAGKTAADLKSKLSAAHPPKALKLALRVQDPGRFDQCRELGFNLFQGAFFKTPEVITARKFTSNEAMRLNLMQAIEQPEVDFEKLAEIIQADASLSYRLLSYLNSAAFGMRQKIKSIHQAIAMLGWRKMKNWLRVVLLNDINQGRDAPELMRLAAQRGKFLEQIAQIYNYWGFDPESLHLLGIFSLLDAMLGMSMRDIVKYLPLDEKLKAALCREPNNEYLPLLQLAQQCEEANWHEVEQMLQRLNMDGNKVQGAFQSAVDWGVELTALNDSAVD